MIEGHFVVSNSLWVRIGPQIGVDELVGPGATLLSKRETKQKAASADTVEM